MKCPGKVYWNVLHSNLPDIWKMFATVLVLWDGFKFEICKVGKSLSTSILTSEALLLHASYIWTEKILGHFWTMTTNNFCSFCYKIECFEIREQFPRFVSLIFWQYSTYLYPRYVDTEYLISNSWTLPLQQSSKLFVVKMKMCRGLFFYGMLHLKNNKKNYSKKWPKYDEKLPFFQSTISKTAWNHPVRVL